MGYRRQVSGSSYRINAISRVSQRQIIKRYMTPISIQLSLAIEIALVPSQYQPTCAQWTMSHFRRGKNDHKTDLAFLAVSNDTTTEEILGEISACYLTLHKEKWNIKKCVSSTKTEDHFLAFYSFLKKKRRKRRMERKRKKSINEVVIQELLAFDQEINWTTTLYINTL